MPTEILSQIVGYLDEIGSVCLGVTKFVVLNRLNQAQLIISTSKRLYNVHFQQHGKVTLTSRIQSPTLRDCAMCPGSYICQLWIHLRDWMPKSLRYCYHGCYKFAPFMYQTSVDSMVCETCNVKCMFKFAGCSCQKEGKLPEGLRGLSFRHTYLNGFR